MKQGLFSFILLLVMTFLMMPVTSFAESSCDGSTAEIVECLRKEYTKVDAALNATYQKLMAMRDVESKKKLVAAEQAWIRFRDAHCAFETDFYRGGSIQPIISLNCSIEATTARTRQLDAELQELNSH